MLVRTVFLIVVVAGLTSCGEGGSVENSENQLGYDLDKLQFVCVRESDYLPNVSENGKMFYSYALFLNSALRDKDYQQIGRFYRLAYAAGSYKAATNLHTLISQGLVASPDPGTEVIDIVESLISAGVPGGYYDMGHYLELGYGVKQDSSRANAYFRRAADLGNPEAQFYVARLLEDITSAEQVVVDMFRCATYQGHAQSAFHYGVFLKVRHAYPEAIEGFQMGVRSGNSNSADFLSGGFSTPDPEDRLYYFGLAEEPERASRYKQIANFLTKFEHLGPKIPDIENIVPLPPAKLPDWDGTFEWKRKRDSTPPPEKPSEELILEIARENNLDPETGLSLPNIK
jgi:uncharacterized protein